MKYSNESKPTVNKLKLSVQGFEEMNQMKYYL